MIVWALPPPAPAPPQLAAVVAPPTHIGWDSARQQGLTLAQFSAQLEPCLTQENTLHTLNTLNTPLTRATQPLRAPPVPYKALKLS